MVIRKVKRAKIRLGKLGQLKILAERKVRMVELDIDVDDRTMDIMAKAGLRLIRNDKKALFNYAFTAALKNLIHK